MHSRSSLNRRQFLARIAAAGLVPPAVGNVVEAAFEQKHGRVRRGGPKDRRSTGETSPQASDFTFQGAFRLPLSIGAGDPQWGLGLAHRYVGGQLHFLSKAHGYPPPPVVYEV